MTVAQLDVTLDRPMPQSPDAERAVLGSILINNHAFYRVIGTIDTDDFFKDAHRTIFATMRRMAEQSRDIEPLTLKEELAKQQVAAMVRTQLGLRTLPQSDAADALAGALCHLRRARFDAPRRRTPANERLQALLATSRGR